MSLNATEISSLIKERIEGVDLTEKTETVGHVLSVKDGVVHVFGLKDVMNGEMLSLPNHVTAIARSVITSNIADKDVVGGMPSRPVSQWRKTQALIHRLEEFFDRLKKVESRLP